MKITNSGARHTVELSAGELAAMVNLFNEARRAHVPVTELQEEIFTEIGQHLRTDSPSLSLSS